MFGRILLAAALCFAPLAAHAQASLGSVAIGSTAQSSVTLGFSSAATLGSISVVTQGAPALDFTNLGTGTCKAGASYAAGQTCTVAVSFKPACAGPRLGQILLEDASNNVLANAFLAGIGTGPQLAYGPGAAIAIAPAVSGKTLIQPSGVAVDGFGTLYIADDNNDRVVILPANGAPATAIDPVVGGSGLRTPRGVAIDAAGNLYISDLDSNRIMEVPADGGTVTATDPVVAGIGLHYPCGLVVDAAGNLYIADVDNARVLEVPAGGGAVLSLDPTVNGEGLNYPVNLALDTAGDLYISDLFNNQVVEMPANGGPAIAIDPIVDGAGLDQPYGIAVDAAGDLFIADSGNNRMIEVPAGGAPAFAFVPTVDGKAIDDPIGIALDPSGNLFIADSNNDRVVELQRSQPPTLSFAGTAIGTASSDSPQTVQLLNIGNQPLTFAIPASGNNPAISANFTLGAGATSDCPLLTAAASAPGTLAAGASCLLPVSFVPAANGSLSGAVTLTDNNLSATNAVQTIPLVGASPVASLSSPTLGFGPQAIGSPSAAQQITLTNTGGASLSIASIGISGGNASSFGSSNTCGATLAIAASCEIQVIFTPSAAGSLTATLAIADNAGSSPQSVALGGTGVYVPAVAVAPASSSSTTAQTLAVAVTVSNATTTQAPTGTVTLASGAYASASTPLSAGAATITIPAGSLAVGTDTLQAAYSPDAASASVFQANTGSAQVVVTAAAAPPAAPSASTGLPSAVTDQSAALAGTVNPNGADTHAWFVYGTSSTLAGASQTASQDLGSGTTITPASANLSGLSAATLYYYQLVAQNGAGTSKGAIDSFTTIGAPYITLNGTAITIAPGASTGNTSTIDIVPWNGFTGAVALSCQVTTSIASPADLPTCSLAPASVNIASANSVQSTLSVGTTAPVAANSIPHLWPSGAGAMLACLLLFAAPAGSRRRTPLLILFALCLTALGAGCSGSAAGGGGGGGASPPPVPGTTPGAYSITVSGTSGSSTVSTTVALTVQ
jgi:sugar lactone lactonase YvrE